MVKNKKFIDLSNGKVFEVIDQFEDIAILDNKSKVKVGTLLDKTYFDEYIDPNSFFRNDRLVSAFTEKIRQLPTDDIDKSQKYDEMINESIQVEANVGTSMNPLFNDSAVLPYDPEEEKRELLEKAKRMYKNQNSTNIDKLKHLLEEQPDDMTPVDRSTSELNIEMKAPEPQQSTVRITQREPNISQTSQLNNVDPIISMFRNVKRNNDFSLSFSINHKIPRLDFIEMMEDSYNTSLIDFLAEEFTNLILLNPDLIKNKISEELRSLVYGRNVEEETNKSELKLTNKKK